MTVYTVALFVHILGALSLFVGIGLQWATLVRLRQAQTMTQVRDRSALVGVQERFPEIGLVLLLLAGGYMATTGWSWTTPWILVALGAFVVLGVVGGGLIDRRLLAIRRATTGAGADDSIPVALQARIADPVLWTALNIAGLLALGVVFLMTNKPDLFVSLLTLAVAIVLGVVLARPWRRPHVGAAPAEGVAPRVSGDQG